jgi:putative oxidoreductase
MSIQTISQSRLHPTGSLFAGLEQRLEALSGFAWPLLRVTAGLLLVPHGAQKLFGLFGGYGLAATGEFFEAKLGLAPGLLFALLAGLVEFGGGLLLAAGFLTRPVALAVAALMAVAVVHVHLGAGFFWTSGGYEYPLLWGVVAVAIALRGGGEFSLDRKLGLRI